MKFGTVVFELKMRIVDMGGRDIFFSKVFLVNVGQNLGQEAGIGVYPVNSLQDREASVTGDIELETAVSKANLAQKRLKLT